MFAKPEVTGTSAFAKVFGVFGGHSKPVGAVKEQFILDNIGRSRAMDVSFVAGRIMLDAEVFKRNTVFGAI